MKSSNAIYLVSRIEEVMVLLVLKISHVHFTNEGLEVQKDKLLAHSHTKIKW